MKSFYDAGVVNRVLIQRHRRRQNHDWYPPDTPVVNPPYVGPVFDQFLSEIDVLLCWETPFDWNILNVCRERGIKTALVPMHEWTPREWPALFDRIIAPSLLDRDYFPGSKFVPVPVRADLWQQRTTAKRFLHNAGNIGWRGHKGTLELLKAVPHVKAPFHLTVRAQDTAELGKLLEQVPEVEKDGRVTVEKGEIPYEQLWDGHDVLIAPEKFNGLSLPLQEGRAAGLLVMTTGRYPHNTWLPREPLIPVSRYERACVTPNYLEFDEAIVDPRDIAATIDRIFGQDITAYSQAGKVWAEEHSWAALKGRWLEALAA